MSKREKVSEDLEIKKEKKKSKSKKSSKEKSKLKNLLDNSNSKKPKKEKIINTENEGALKRKKGRPFGTTNKAKAELKKKEAEALTANADRILGLLEVNPDDPASLTQRDMFERVLKMLPAAEKKYYESPSQQNVYAFNALVTQTRELIADFQAKADNSKVLDNILYVVLQPTLLSFVQFLMDSNHNLHKQLKDIVKESKHKQLKDIIDNTTKSMGAYGQEMFATLKERLPSALE